MTIEFKITLRMDNRDKEQTESMQDAVVQAAQGLITLARLTASADKFAPDVVVETGDMIFGSQEIEIFKPEF
jgi:hypothetical protein